MAFKYIFSAILMVLLVSEVFPPSGNCHDRSLETVPADAFHYQMRGNNFLKEKQYGKAVQSYRKSLALSPGSTASYFNLAIAYYSERRIEKAARALENLLKYDAADIEAHYNLGCLSLYLQDLAKAEHHFNRAYALRHVAPSFASAIEQALQFVKSVKKDDSSTRDLLFYLLKDGLPPLSFAKPA